MNSTLWVIKILLMTIITAFSVIMLAIICILLNRLFFSQKKNVPEELFTEALRKENSGYFETAIDTYERALDEVKKNRFGGSSLKSQIIKKLKVLYTVMEYKNGFHFGR